MFDYLTLVGCEIKLLIPVIVGIVIAKAGMLNEDFSKKLTAFLLKVINPFLIIGSIIGIERSKENMIKMGKAAVVCLIFHLTAAGIAIIATLFTKDIKAKSISRFAIMFRNTGFFGMPLLIDLYGSIGGFYASVELIIFNLICWSYGIVVLSRANPGLKINAKKIFVNPGMVASYIGIALYFSGLPLYQPIVGGVKTIGEAATPIAMIIIGGMIARAPIKSFFCTLRTYHVCGVTLLLLPVACFGILKLLGFSGELLAFGTIIAALPVGTNAATFSENYDISPEFAAQQVGMSTLLTLLTIPLVLMLL